MADYREQSRRKADDLIISFGEAAIVEARRRLALALLNDDIEECFVWLDAWAVFNNREPW